MEPGTEAREIASNAFWLLLDKFLRAGAGFLLSVWAARALGPVSFGWASYAMALVALFGTFASLGLDTLLTRDLVSARGDSAEILGTAALLRTAGAFTALVACWAVAYSGREPADPAFLACIIASLALLFQPADVLDVWFRSRLRSRSTVIARNVALVPGTILKAAVLLTGASLNAFLAAGVAETALGAAILLFLYIRQGGTVLGWRPSFARAMRLLNEGWPFALSLVAVTVYMRIDQVMLAEMAGADVAGRYSAAARLTEATFLIPTILSASFVPMILRKRESDRNSAMRGFRVLLTILGATGVAAAVFVGFGSEMIVSVLFGDQYRQSAEILEALALGIPFVYLGAGGSAFYVSEGLSKGALFRTASGAVCNIALNLAFIPRYGAVGAAWATVASQALASYIADGIQAPARELFRMKTRGLLLYGILDIKETWVLRK